MVSQAIISIVKVFASLSSFYLFASPMADIRCMQASKTPHSKQILPYTSMLCNAICWCLYGILTGNIFPLIITNGIGIFICIYYLVIFSKCASDQDHVRRCIITLLTLISSFFAFCLLAPLSHQAIQSIVGYTGIAVCTILFASPLVLVKKVLQEKNTDALPLSMIVAAFMNSVLWSVYGLMLQDSIIILPNLVNFMLSTAQLSLFLVFPRNKGYSSMHSSTAIMDAKMLPSDAIASDKLEKV